MFAASDGSLLAISAIATAFLTAFGLLIAQLVSVSRVRNEVTPNGGKSSSLGDRMVRLEDMAHRQVDHQLKLATELADYQAETRGQLTQLDIAYASELARLQSRDADLAARLEVAVARLDAMSGTPINLAAAAEAVTPPRGTPAVPSPPLPL